MPIDNYIQLFAALSKQVHSGNLTTGQIDEAVTLFTQQALMHGVEKGYGITLKDADYTTPDAVMLAKLEKDTFYFSAAKNYWNVKELNQALIGTDGKLKSFSKFREAADAINEKYNVTHLRAEYNHAVASSQMARQWEDIKKASGTHPFLKYVTAGDAHVRASHKQWHGIIRRWDDAFWDAYYPPNDWNCRCDVEQLTDSAKPTPADKLPNPADVDDNGKQILKPLFKTNTAKEGVIYPPSHPYHALPDIDAKGVLDSAARIYKANTNAYFKIAEFKNGSTIKMHGLTDARDPLELKANIEEAVYWAKAIEDDYKLLPHIDIDKVKSPEFAAGDYISDFKATKEKCSAKSVTRLIQDGDGKECDVLHFNLIVHDTPEETAKAFRAAFVSTQKPLQFVSKIYVRFGEKYIEFTAEEAIMYKHKSKFKWLLKHK